MFTILTTLPKCQLWVISTFIGWCWQVQNQVFLILAFGRTHSLEQTLCLPERIQPVGTLSPDWRRSSSKGGFIRRRTYLSTSREDLRVLPRTANPALGSQIRRINNGSTDLWGKQIMWKKNWHGRNRWFRKTDENKAKQKTTLLPSDLRK